MQVGGPSPPLANLVPIKVVRTLPDPTLFRQGLRPGSALLDNLCQFVVHAFGWWGSHWLVAPASSGSGFHIWVGRPFMGMLSPCPRLCPSLQLVVVTYSYDIGPLQHVVHTSVRLAPWLNLP